MPAYMKDAPTFWIYLSSLLRAKTFCTYPWQCDSHYLGNHGNTTYLTIKGELDSIIIFFSEYIWSTCRVSTMWCFFRHFNAYVFLSPAIWTFKNRKQEKNNKLWLWESWLLQFGPFNTNTRPLCLFYFLKWTEQCRLWWGSEIGLRMVLVHVTYISSYQ